MSGRFLSSSERPLCEIIQELAWMNLDMSSCRMRCSRCSLLSERSTIAVVVWPEVKDKCSSRWRNSCVQSWATRMPSTWRWSVSWRSLLRMSVSSWKIQLGESKSCQARKSWRKIRKLKAFWRKWRSSHTPKLSKLSIPWEDTWRITQRSIRRTMKKR